MRKQKTAPEAGALIDDAKKWKSMNWTWIRREVRRLQVRIAKAVKENRWNRVKILQYLLTRSRYAKLLAVKRVTSNKGGNRSRAAPQGLPLEMLVPHEGKLSRTVLRGEWG